MSEYDKVRRFHDVMGLPVRIRPSMPDEATRLLRCRLLLEETLEYIRASGCSVRVLGHTFTSADCMSIATTHAPNLAAMAQENADVRYISHGNDLAMGVDGRVFDEVHRANLAKAPGGVVLMDERGKVRKPEGWKPPNVGRVLAEWDLDSDNHEWEEP